MRSFAHVIGDPLGLHARSCVMLAREASRWHSNIKMRCDLREADGKSMAALLSLHGVRGDQLVVSCDGADEAQAASALEALMRMSL